MAHGVEDGQVGQRTVQRIVEGVAGHAQRGFEHSGDGDLSRGEAARRQQGPLHLGGDGHPRRAADVGEDVAEPFLDHDQRGELRGEPVALGEAHGISCDTKRDLDNPEPQRAVDERAPHAPIPAVPVADGGLPGDEDATGHGPVKGLGPPVRGRRPGKRHELGVGVVDEVDDRGIGAAVLPYALRSEGGDLAGGDERADVRRGQTRRPRPRGPSRAQTGTEPRASRVRRLPGPGRVPGCAGPETVGPGCRLRWSGRVRDVRVRAPEGARGRARAGGISGSDNRGLGRSADGRGHAGLRGRFPAGAFLVTQGFLPAQLRAHTRAGSEM